MAVTMALQRMLTMKSVEAFQLVARWSLHGQEAAVALVLVVRVVVSEMMRSDLARARLEQGGCDTKTWRGVFGVPGWQDSSCGMLAALMEEEGASPLLLLASLLLEVKLPAIDLSRVRSCSEKEAMERGPLTDAL